MKRRAFAHDYTMLGIYHITIRVNGELGHPLGSVAGNAAAVDGAADAPHTILTPVGQMVERELLTSIHAHYPMVSVQEYVIMPEHLHALVIVQDRIVSGRGKILPLGQVIAGFKKGATGCIGK